VDKYSSLSCCADLYASPLGKLLLGNSWHPGGLALTRALAESINLSMEDRLLDVACGRGASALMLAQVYKCQVVGIDASTTALEYARKEATRYRLDEFVTFREGDATCLAFPDCTFTAAICECATTLFADKGAALSETARVLRRGGHLALSGNSYRSDGCVPGGYGAFARAGAPPARHCAAGSAHPGIDCHARAGTPS